MKKYYSIGVICWEEDHSCRHIRLGVCDGCLKQTYEIENRALHVQKTRARLEEDQHELKDLVTHICNDVSSVASVVESGATTMFRLGGGDGELHPKGVMHEHLEGG